MDTISDLPLADGAVLRAARPADVPDILALIHALAVYEKEPDAVSTTESDLHRVLFEGEPAGADPVVFAHVVEHDGALAGIAVWFRTFSTWEGTLGIHLEDLFVLPEHRGSGYGKALLSSLAEICVTEGYRRLEWSVLDWNEPSIRFYRSLGATSMDGWSVNRLEGAALTAVGTRAG